MEKTSKSYQIAYCYSQFVQSRSPPRQILNQLPSIQEVDPSTREVKETQNIFNSQQPIRMRRVSIEEQAAYGIVGIKELRAYQSRQEKKKRNMGSVIKRSTESAISLSRISVAKPVPQHRYLSKEEVIKMHSPSNSNLTYRQQTFLSSKHNKTLDSHNLSVTVSTTPHLHPNKHHHHLSQQFSYSKLKQRMQKYKLNWNKQMLNKTKHMKGKIKNSSDVQVTSVLVGADSYRLLAEEKEHRQLQKQLENIQPKLWDLILRSSHSMDQLCVKQIQRVSKGKIQSRGKAKLQQQIKWVQEMDKQGYLFRSRRDVSVENGK